MISDIQKCGEYTDLSLNLDKCVCYDLSAMSDTQVAGVLVTSTLVKYLGAYVGCGEQVENLNFEGPLCKMKLKAKRWQARVMTLPVRILVAKILFAVLFHASFELSIYKPKKVGFFTDLSE